MTTAMPPTPIEIPSQSPRALIGAQSSAALYGSSENVRVHAVIVAELELGDVQREIFGADFVEGADDAALHQRPEAFNGLRVDRTANVLAPAMVHDAVRERAIKEAIGGKGVGAEQAHLVRYRFVHEFDQGFAPHVGDNAGDDITLAAHGADHDLLARTGTASSATIARAALVFVAVAREAADESLINLDNAHQLVKFLIDQTSADAMAHMPSGAVRAETHHPVDLEGAHSLLARQHQVNDAKPLPERLIGVLENRPGNVREAVIRCGRRASVTQPVPFHRAMGLHVHIAATGAGNALGPAVADQIGATLVLGRERPLPVSEGHLRDGFWLFRAGHGSSLFSTKPSISSYLVKSSIIAAMSAPTRPVLRWYGGKWRLAPWIIAHFPAHRVYVEPFGGAGSVLLRKPRAYAEVWNDLDGEAVNLFRVLRDEAEAQRLIDALRLTPFSRDEFLSARDVCDEPVERARRLIAYSFMGFGANAHARVPTGFRSNSNRSGTTPAHDWANYPDALAYAVNRLSGVVVENKDAKAVMATHDSPVTLHYVDPPYVWQTRRSACRLAPRGSGCDGTLRLGSLRAPPRQPAFFEECQQIAVIIVRQFDPHIRDMPRRTHCHGRVCAMALPRGPLFEERASA